MSCQHELKLIWLQNELFILIKLPEYAPVSPKNIPCLIFLLRILKSLPAHNCLPGCWDPKLCWTWLTTCPQTNRCHWLPSVNCSVTPRHQVAAADTGEIRNAKELKLGAHCLTELESLALAMRHMHPLKLTAPSILAFLFSFHGF